MLSQITANSTECFSEIRREARAMYLIPYELQVSQIGRAGQQRAKLFKDCLRQYQNYISRQNQILDSNSHHCKPRNDWYREQVNKAWGICIANRPLIMRSIARTNVLKKDVGEWLQRVDEGSVDVEPQRPQSLEQLEGSRLIDKYNQILLEYGHKV